MTDEFKQNVLKYLTGNFEDIEGTENYILTDLKRTSNNLREQIQNELDGKTFSQDGYVLMKDSNNNYNGKILLYGYYSPTLSTRNGAMCLLDSELNLIQVIKSYSSGTELKVFKFLNVANDGSLYGIEKTSYDTNPTTEDSNNRFVMLNNPSIKLPTDDTYKLVLRRSYLLQGDAANIGTGNVYNCMKSPNSSNYLIVGTPALGSTASVSITTLKIKVGESNEWTDYTALPTSIGFYRDSYAEWDEEGNAKIMVAYASSSDGAVTNSNIILSINNGQEMVTTQTFNMENFFRKQKGTNIYIIHIYYNIINFNKSKILVVGTFEENGVEKGGLEFTNILFEPTMTTRTLNTVDIEEGYMEELFIYANIINLQEDISFISYRYNTNAVGRNTIWSVNLALPPVATIPTSNQYIQYGLVEGSTLNLNIFGISNQYNLFSINYIFTDFDSGNTYKDNYQLILNMNNYPYSGRTNVNSLVPNSSVLYNDENVVLFARNLYNKTINNNTTLSVLEIPNSFVNDITIAKEQLWGMNNNVLIDNEDQITKNIYETLYLNFNNTLIIKNANDEENEILNIQGAGRLNRNISTEDNPTTKTNYNNTKANKIKINYNDDTNIIINSIPSKVTDTMYMYDFDVYVPSNKLVNNIQIISNDENTVYQEINTSTLESNKFYNITQCVEII